MGIKLCRKCSYVWKSWKPNPVACPKCQSTRWFRDKLPTQVSKYGIPSEPGQVKMILYAKDINILKKLKGALLTAKAKNPRLKVTPRAEGLLVEYVRF